MDKYRRRAPYILVAIAVVGLIAWLWGRHAATQRLVRQLDSRNLELRTDAARVLLERGVLTDSLPAQPERRRAHTAAALGRIGTAAAMTQLIALLKDPENRPQRAAAVSLGSLGTKAILSLLPVLKEGDDRAKAAAVSAFADIGPAAVPALTKALSDAGQREQAAVALGRIGGVGMQPLLKAAWDRNNDLRKIAIRVVGDVGDRRGARAAIAALQIAALRGIAITALGRMGDRQATPYLIPYLADRNLRLDAATSLGQLADARAAAPLVAKLDDPERQFHERAVWALQRIGAGAVPEMVTALHSDSKYVRRAAAEGLRWSRAAQSISSLVSALRDPDRVVRAAAARALGWSGNAAAVQPLLAALTDPDWHVADAAVHALGEVSVPAVEPLVAHFESADPTQRLLASEALTRMGRAAVPRLIQATYSASPAISEWAVITLGQIGDRAAIDRLRQIAATGQGNAKWAAGEALQRLGAESTPD